MSRAARMAAWSLAAFAIPAAIPVVIPVVIPVPAAAAGAVGGPRVLTGEALAGRDIEVHAAPDPQSRTVMTLSKGRTVTSFGAARGSTWLQIALGGRDVGYVPQDALDSIYKTREVSGRAAVVSRIRWAPAGALLGTHVVQRKLSAAGGRRGRTVLEPGQVLTLLDLKGGIARVSSETMTGLTVPADALLPILGVHPEPPGHAAGFFVARTGEYRSGAEAWQGWQDFLASAGAHYAAYSPFIYPAIGRSGIAYALAFGPFDRNQAESQCVALAQRLMDCWIVEVAGF